MSFAGGGSDLKTYYQHDYGSVVSTAINKYIYITVNKRFTDKIRVGYSKIEEVKNIEDIEHNLVRYLAAYYGSNNIRANCISPGGIYQKNENKIFVEKYNSKTPLGRKANPDEINGAVVFLASGASSYVTGHNLVVDGGYTIW